MHAKANDGTTLELPADREILIRRTFKAPKAVVLEAITRPEHVRRWWAPASKGQMTECQIDFRVGGAWRFAMRTPDGMDVGFSGKYLEISSPARFVQTEVFDPFPDAAATVTVTLEENNGVTTMVNRSVYPSREIRDQVIATGMEEGMRESMLQLSTVVSSLI